LISSTFLPAMRSSSSACGWVPKRAFLTRARFDFFLRKIHPSGHPTRRAAVDAESQPDDPLDRLSALVRAERGSLVAVARGEGMSAEEAVECVQDALCTFLAR